MFTEDVVKIPEKVKFNKKNAGIYVYHIFNSTYSKEKKYSTDNRVLIGKKIDETTMHPNKKYFEIYNVEPKIEQELPREFSTTLSVGDTALIQSISENIGLSKCLSDVYGKDNKNMIINLATYHIIENSSVYQHYPAFAFKHPVLGNKIFTDAHISKFLNEKINDSLIHDFFGKWIKNQNINGSIMISYDSTNINCESEGVELNEFGKAKDDNEKELSTFRMYLIKKTEPHCFMSYILDQLLI